MNLRNARPGRRMSSAIGTVLAGAMIFFGASALRATGQRGIRAPLIAARNRKAAPSFRLLNAEGRTVRLSDFHGSVLLLDFWATACDGCVLEVPWFVEMAETWRDKGLRVVGISMDILYEDLKNAGEAWQRVTPFALRQKVNYPILMGDDQVRDNYRITSIPVTFLIDANGRIAAKYVGGTVDRADLENNVQQLIAER